jgi:hypothetical protein
MSRWRVGQAGGVVRSREFVALSKGTSLALIDRAMTKTLRPAARARVPGFLVMLAVASCGKGMGSGGTGGSAAGTSGGGTVGGSPEGGMSGSAAGASAGGMSGSAGSTSGTGAGGLGGTTGTADWFGGSGTGLFTGTAGTGVSCVQPPPRNCGTSLCGNGTRDTCEYSTGPGTCPAASFTEECDGTDFGAVNCIAWGFGSGTLTCSYECRVDFSTCRACGMAPSIASCGQAPFTSDPSRMGIGANDTQVAVAWIQQQPFGSTPALYVSRLSPMLELIGTTHFDDTKLGGSLENVVIAPLASGWVAAGWANSEVFIRGIDANGGDLGRLTVDTVGVDDLLAMPVLASRPNGGPLLVWQSKTALKAAVVAADGRSISTPRTLPSGGVVTGFDPAVYAGGAFYIAELVGPPFATTPQPMRIQRVEADGTPGTAVDALPGVTAWTASLVEGADDLRVLYRGAVPGGTSSSNQSVQLQRIDASGQAVLPAPVVIDQAEGGWATGTAFGGDTVVVSAKIEHLLSVTRIGSDGTIVTPTRTVAATQFSSFFSQGFARRGADVVIAWAEIQKIMLARVTP